MNFKKIALETEQFGEDLFEDLKAILSDECQACDAPKPDIYNMMKYKNDNQDNLIYITLIYYIKL